MYIKKFTEWFLLKPKIEEEIRPVTFRPGDIRWVVLGVNIGSEIDGKGDSFNRPCIIVDIFSDKLALVFPMSTKVKKVPGYIPITLPDGKEVSICVSQGRTVSPKRILGRLTSISKDKLENLKEEYKKFYRL